MPCCGPFLTTYRSNDRIQISLLANTHHPSWFIRIIYSFMANTQFTGVAPGALLRVVSYNVQELVSDGINLYASCLAAQTPISGAAASQSGGGDANRIGDSYGAKSGGGGGNRIGGGDGNIIGVGDANRIGDSDAAKSGGGGGTRIGDSDGAKSGGGGGNRIGGGDGNIIGGGDGNGIGGGDENIISGVDGHRIGGGGGNRMGGGGGPASARATVATLTDALLSPIVREAQVRPAFFIYI